MTPFAPLPPPPNKILIVPTVTFKEILISEKGDQRTNDNQDMISDDDRGQKKESTLLIPKKLVLDQAFCSTVQISSYSEYLFINL